MLLSAKNKIFCRKKSLILDGKFGNCNSLSSSLQEKALPFEKLTAAELKSELYSRNIVIKHLKISC